MITIIQKNRYTEKFNNRNSDLKTMINFSFKKLINNNNDNNQVENKFLFKPNDSNNNKDKIINTENLNIINENDSLIAYAISIAENYDNQNLIHLN